MNPLVETVTPSKPRLPKTSPNVLTQYFFVIIGVLSLLYVLAGFTPTYFLPVAKGSFSAKPVYHIHGIMYSLWIVMIITQPLLIKLRLTHLHKKIGYAGLALAIGMFIIGIVMAFVSNQAAIDAGNVNRAMAFLIVPLTDMILFGTFITLTIFNLRDREMHKRLILLATLSILPAAFGRIIGIYGIHPLVGLFLQESILFAGIIFDLLTRKKIHSAYILGGGAVVLIHLVRFPIGETETWMNFARWLTM